jgi:hypothetical protein
MNLLSLGALTTEQLLALYIERSIGQETIKQNSKLNCERLFLEYKKEYKADTIEIAELEIDYEEQPATP